MHPRCRGEVFALGEGGRRRLEGRKLRMKEKKSKMKGGCLAFTMLSCTESYMMNE